MRAGGEGVIWRTATEIGRLRAGTHQQREVTLEVINNTMRRKTATTGLLVLGIVTVLAMLGFVYGSWEEDFNVDGKVETGDVSINPQVEIRKNDLNGKQVGRCNYEIGNEVNKKTQIRVKIENGYPGFICLIKVDLINKSTVPVIVSGVVQTDPQGIDVEILDPSGTKAGDCSALLNNTQKNDPRHELCQIKVEVKKTAEQNKTGDKAYRFAVDLEAELKGKPEHTN
jgi:hypothetical protein